MICFGFRVSSFGFPPQGAPRFEAHTVTGTTPVGALDRLGPDWSVRLSRDNTRVEVKGGELLGLRRPHLPLPRHPSGAQVVFTNGDRVPLHADSPLRLARGRLSFRPAAPLSAPAGQLDPPVAHVALVWLAPPDHAQDPALLLRRLVTQKRSRDVVLLRSGDAVEGTLLGLEDGGCRVKAGRREVDVPLSRVAAIALNTEVRPPVVPAVPHAHLVLAGGCRLALAEAALKGKEQKLTGKALFGSAVDVPLAQVTALDVRGGPAVYLSELAPHAYEYTPFLDATWPLVKDASVTGGELRLRGSTYDKGLGTHAAARVTYELGGRYRRFEALVGLDEDSAPRGQARVRVLVDGKDQRLVRGGELAARAGPLAVRVDVRGARELTLVVDFGRLGDVQAHVNWADARLVK